MKKPFRVLCLFSVFWLCAPPLIAAGVAAPVQTAPSPYRPEATIRLYDYSGFDHETLHAGMAEATRIFDHAGITIAWTLCPCVSLDPADDVEDPDPQLRGPNDFALWLLPESRAEGIGLKTDILGIALVPRDSGSGTVAVIMSDQVQQVAHPGWRGTLLGHVIAHEIGHLWLGPGHSLTGIMQAPWSSNVLEIARRGHLLFTVEQARAMREHLLEPRYMSPLTD